MSDGSSLEVDLVLGIEVGVLLGVELVQNIPIAIDDLFTVEMAQHKRNSTLQRH